MTPINRIDITLLSDVEDSQLITYPNFAINRNVNVANAIGRFMKIGEPYRILENRILRILNGHMRVSINLNEYILSKNEAIYFGQNSIVEIIEYSPNTVVDILGFALLNECDNTHMVYLLNEKHCECIESYFQLIYSISSIQPFDNLSIGHLLQSLYYRILAIDKAECHTKPQPKGSKDKLFRIFIELLNSHTGKFPLSFYANKMNISSQYLSRLVFETSGTNASNWINRVVIMQAKLLLRKPKLTIEQIADNLNFPSLPYFCRYFKRETGLTPTEYRNMH